MILDSKLNWIAHVKDRAHKADLQELLREEVYRPERYCRFMKLLSHGCVIWWPMLNIKSARDEVKKIQRLVCFCITGVMKTTATAGMEVTLAVLPVHTTVKAKADRLVQNRPSLIL